MDGAHTGGRRWVGWILWCTTNALVWPGCNLGGLRVSTLLVCHSANNALFCPYTREGQQHSTSSTPERIDGDLIVRYSPLVSGPAKVAPTPPHTHLRDGREVSQLEHAVDGRERGRGIPARRQRRPQVGVGLHRQDEVRPGRKRGRLEPEHGGRPPGEDAVVGGVLLTVHHEEVPVRGVGVLGGERPRDDGAELDVVDEAGALAAVLVGEQARAEGVRGAGHGHAGQLSDRPARVGFDIGCMGKREAGGGSERAARGLVRSIAVHRDRKRQRRAFAERKETSLASDRGWTDAPYAFAAARRWRQR